jgi:hypothetical protein
VKKKKKKKEKLGVVLFLHILEGRRFFFFLSIPELFMFLSSVACREGGRISCFFCLILHLFFSLSSWKKVAELVV